MTPSPAVGDPGGRDATDPAGLPSWPKRGWRFWAAVVAFWLFFGFVVGNHVYFSMRGHGHGWGRIILWQTAGAAAWIALTPLILALDRRLPIGRTGLRRFLLVHGTTAVSFAAVRLVPLTLLSLLLDPFAPVPREASFFAEYGQLLAEWLFLDVIIYGGILTFAHALDLRERFYRDRLRASHLRAELSAAELRALELEIHPHFLFNALHGIAVLVRGGERERSLEMIVALADLLRLTLKRRGRTLVTLEEELQHVTRYLDVQKARFADRLEVEIDFEDGTRALTVPHLVLQPLVENAFRHGIERNPGGGSVAIRARRADGGLELSVVDDGPGAEADAVWESQGVGLRNLRSRLGALYGDEWQLTVAGADAPASGTTVTVVLPWREARP